MEGLFLHKDFVPSLIAYALSLTVLTIGSITDLKTREVPDWVNYGLIASGVGLNLLFSVIYSNVSFIINSILGLAIFFGIAYIMFYAGQWGGGDSKMLMGLGAIIGMDFSFKANQFLLSFLINALFAGALYGLLWSIFIAVKNRKKFLREYRRISSSNKISHIKKIFVVCIIVVAVSLFFIESFYFRVSFLSLALILLITFYLWIFVKSIEKSSMHKLVNPDKLTEGDWIVNDVFVDKQYICGPKDLGIDKKQIKKLIKLHKQGKVKKILIKEGIPFVPSFLVAFIITLFFGNVFLRLF